MSHKWVVRLFGVVCGLTFAVILFGTIDGCVGRTVGTVRAKVIGRHHSPGYFQTTIMPDGNGGSNVMVTYIPDSWYVEVVADGLDTNRSVSHATHDDLANGGEVDLEVRSRAFTGGQWVGEIVRVYPANR